MVLVPLFGGSLMWGRWVADNAFRRGGQFHLRVGGSQADAQPVRRLWCRSRPRLPVSSLSDPPETTQVSTISCLAVQTVAPCPQNSFL